MLVIVFSLLYSYVVKSYKSMSIFSPTVPKYAFISIAGTVPINFRYCTSCQKKVKIEFSGCLLKFIFFTLRES